MAMDKSPQNPPISSFENEKILPDPVDIPISDTDRSAESQRGTSKIETYDCTDPNEISSASLGQPTQGANEPMDTYSNMDDDWNRVLSFNKEPDDQTAQFLPLYTFDQDFTSTPQTSKQLADCLDLCWGDLPDDILDVNNFDPQSLYHAPVS